MGRLDEESTDLAPSNTNTSKEEEDDGDGDDCPSSGRVAGNVRDGNTCSRNRDDDQNNLLNATNSSHTISSMDSGDIEIMKIVHARASGTCCHHVPTTLTEEESSVTVAARMPSNAATIEENEDNNSLDGKHQKSDQQQTSAPRTENNRGTEAFESQGVPGAFAVTPSSSNDPTTPRDDDGLESLQEDIQSHEDTSFEINNQQPVENHGSQMSTMNALSEIASLANLTVAILVEDDENDEERGRDLPKAQEVDAAELERFHRLQLRKSATTSVTTSGDSSDTMRIDIEKVQRSRLLKIGAVAGSCCIVVLVVILLAVFVAETHNTQNESNQNQKDKSKAELEEYVFNLLPRYTQASIITAIDKGKKSPQYQAYQWMLQDPSLSEYSDFRLEQRFSLATFYYATGGDDWIVNEHWLDYSIHECEWHSFSYESALAVREFYTSEIGVDVFPNLEFLQHKHSCGNDENDQSYQHLWHFRNGMLGYIPDEISMLTSLRSISLLSVGSSFGSLEGTLPTTLRLLTNLEAFVVTGTRIGGTLPTEMGLFNKDLFRILLVAENQHTGTIPSEIAQLENLEYLALFANHRLTGTIPGSLGNLTKLEKLFLFENEFNGEIPSSLGNLKHLQWMIFDKNSLSSSIPTELGLLSSAPMVSLQLRDNSIPGSIPTQLCLLTTLRSLDLDNNMLSGPIPSCKMDKLERLGLGKNLLTGSIPASIWEMMREANNSDSPPSSPQTYLKQLNVIGNPELSGVIPSDVCQSETEKILFDFDCTNILCGCNCSCSEEVDTPTNNSAA